MRRELGDELHRAISRALARSIEWARANPVEAMDYAMEFGRGMDRDTCERFVRMYVNDLAVSLGATGRAALERLYAMAVQRSLIPAAPPVDPVAPG
jgi:1,4-dihydroxy-6-naphthoate synthase